MGSSLGGIRRILFLDIDGVLNHHEWDLVSGSCVMVRDCMRQLNRILQRCRPEVVISSAWRYSIVPQCMTILGFKQMLQTHGLWLGTDIVGRTRSDEEIPTRGRQIDAWLSENVRQGDTIVYCAIDDLGETPEGELDDLEIEPRGHKLFRTHKHRGLTEYLADQVIIYLGGSQLS